MLLLLHDGDFAVMQGPDTILLFSYSSSGLSADDGIIALDDRCEIIQDYRAAMSRLTDFARFHPDAGFVFSYDGERTVLIIGGQTDELVDGYIGPYSDPIEAYTEADDVRTANIKKASAPPEPDNP